MTYFIVRLQAKGNKRGNFLYATSSGKLTTQKKYAYHFKRLDNALIVAHVHRHRYIGEVLQHET